MSSSRPAVTAITPISIDHVAFLGNTLGAIAGEKAGILKPNVTGVVAPQPAEAEAVIEARAATCAAPLYRAGREWNCAATAGGMRYEGTRWRLDLPRPSLLGMHQIVNAGVAIACLENLAGFNPRPRGTLPPGCAISTGRRGCSCCAPDRWSRRCLRAASYGSTAATTRPRARCWARLPRTGGTARSISSSAC